MSKKKRWRILITYLGPCEVEFMKIVVSAMTQYDAAIVAGKIAQSIPMSFSVEFQK